MLCQNCEMKEGIIETSFEGLTYVVCEECNSVLQDIYDEGGFEETIGEDEYDL